VQILTYARSEALPTYMVAPLRTHDAPPLWCNGLASFWLSVAPGECCAGAVARHEMGVGGSAEG
jgi:hypothetical protein